MWGYQQTKIDDEHCDSCDDDDDDYEEVFGQSHRSIQNDSYF